MMVSLGLWFRYFIVVRGRLDNPHRVIRTYYYKTKEAYIKFNWDWGIGLKRPDHAYKYQLAEWAWEPDDGI